MKRIEDLKLSVEQEINTRIEMGITEKETGDFLKKILHKCDNATEVLTLAQLGEMYKKTGFYYTQQLEKFSDSISYFKKNDTLSFRERERERERENLLIIGDNYKALLNLQIQYRNKVKMIYIDPPYGKDSMGEFADTNYDNSISRDNLLSMLDVRLRLAKELLTEDGVIFCSIDDRNQAYVKCLFDEIFGERNFISCCPRKSRGSATTKSDTELQNLHDYLLIYCKDKTINGFRLKKIGIQNYPFEDERGKYRLLDLQDNGPHGTRTARPNLYYPIYQKQNGSLSLQNDGYSVEFLPHKHKNDDGRWMWSKKKFESDSNYLCIYNDKVQIKHYFNIDEDQNKYQHFMSWLDNFKNSEGTLETNQILKKGIFDNPKPIDLIKWCINLIKEESFIILDFFAGSGTTGQAVLEANEEDDGNRQFILVQLPEKLEQGSIQESFCKENNLPVNLSSITYERLKRVMTGKTSKGNSDFEWIKKNKALGGNLTVVEINEVANFENDEKKCAFSVIDETLYGQPKFESLKDKITWVCENFENTQKTLEE